MIHLLLQNYYIQGTVECVLGIKRSMNKFLYRVYFQKFIVITCTSENIPSTLVHRRAPRPLHIPTTTGRVRVVTQRLILLQGL